MTTKHNLVQSTVQQKRKNKRGKIFLNLVDKHFQPSNCLHKIFNRNSVKVSYSCMDNCKSIISKHNTRILSTPKSTTQTSSSTNSATCNCNNSNECPLQKKCLLDCIVYKAEVVTNNSEPKEYIGMTGNTFKKLFSKCVHLKRFLAGKFERAQAQSRTQTQSHKQYNGYQRHQAGKVS